MKTLKELQEEKYKILASLDEIQIKLMALNEDEAEIELKKKKLSTAKFTIERKLAQINREIGDIQGLINPSREG